MNQINQEVKFDATSSAVRTSGDKDSVRAVGVIGCSSGCGKTTLMSGIASLLVEQKIPVRAIKPLSIGDVDKSNTERLFISTISGTSGDYDKLTMEFPPSVPDEIYAEFKRECSTPGLTMIEFPGTVATPLSLDLSSGADPNLGWQSTAEMMAKLGMPAILVASYDPDVFERLDMAFNYLKSKKVNVLAFSTVEANAKAARFMDHFVEESDIEMMFAERFNTPFLGRLKHSSSISVTIACHGNLKNLSADCLDMMVLRRVLRLPLVG